MGKRFKLENREYFALDTVLEKISELKKEESENETNNDSRRNNKNSRKKRKKEWDK